MNARHPLPGHMLALWGAALSPNLWTALWIAVMLGILAWLDRSEQAAFLIPPFAATLTIIAYLPEVAIAQPLAVVCGSVAGAAIGTGLSLLLGFGPDVAVAAALSAMVALPLLRIFHPPGVALAMYPALLHPGALFPLVVVLPFALVAVISASVLSRLMPRFPRYPRPLRM